jgi:DNA repair protein RecO (recombination protein O)
MLLSQKGIVFKTTKYKESSVIAQIYSDQIGLSSYLMNGVRNFKSKTSPALFQPGSVIDFEVYFKEGNSMHRIKEIKNGLTFGVYPNELQRGALRLFMAEVSSRTILESEKNPGLFSFLLSYFSYLENPSLRLGSYAVQFLAKLAAYLGISPDFTRGVNRGYLDLREGAILEHPAAHTDYLSIELTELWKKCFLASPFEKGDLCIAREEREILLEKILDYYRIHIPGMLPIRSHLIFRKIFNAQP